MGKPLAIVWGLWAAALVLTLGGCTSSLPAGGGTSGTGGAGGAPCVPVDDHNPCTDDVCDNGVPVSKPAAAGTPCSTGGTVCDGLGTCVACLAPADCPGKDDACQARTCTQGQCGLDFTAAGTALPVQTAGDCQRAVCDGHGAAIQQNDDADLPVDNAACTADVCTAGVPSNPALAVGTACGPTLVCDGAGLCVGCAAPSDCPGSDDACKTRTCVSGVCGVVFTAAKTPLGAQTTGDCLQAVCDGSGHVSSIADDTDLPPDDGNACTSAACHAGAPSHPAKANGIACNDGDACTQTDTCQAGACTGESPVVCSASDACHVAGFCDPVSGTCSSPAANDGTACDDGDACTKADQCTGGLCGGTAYACSATGCDASSSCDGNGGCVAVDDVAGTSCLDDGNPCTSDICDSAATCTHPAVASGKSCGAGLVCVGTVCSADCFIGGTLHAAGAVNPTNACQVCAPGTSTTAWSSRANGTACNDGDACTQIDSCQAGTCTGGNPVVCAASDPCHTAGACNPGTGICSNPAAANGTACDDGDACTQTDTCQAGTCAGSNPVVCAASDQCHVAGVCDAASGTCSSPAKAEGVACNDGDACTQTDTCQGGTCTGSNPVVCAASDPCHVAGVCNAASGTCSNPAANDGTACDDGNACTKADQCAGGVCHGTAYTCSATGCDASSSCDGNGGCVVVNDVAGTSCPDDGNPCTGDICDSTGTCTHPAVASGASCGAGLVCNGTACSADCFIGGTPYAAGTVNPTNACQVCTPGTSTSGWSIQANGTACDDGNACTKADQCTGGACHGTAYTCSATSCDASSSCDGHGGCVVVDDVAGTSCPDDGNPCTGDACDGAGTCTHPAVASGASCGAGLVCFGSVCSSDCFIGGTFYAAGAVNPSNACQVCAPGTSTSAWANRANGTACNDGDPCTQTDTCQAGTCTGGNPVVCSASDPCHVAGACNPATGVCSLPAVNDGTPCDDGNACTAADQCTGGVCGGTAYTCSAASCDASSSCDGNGGCVVVDDVAGTSCPDDGNPCTGDTCDGTGTCTHPAMANGAGCGAGFVCDGSVCSPECFIGGTFYATGTVNPGNACQVCTPGTSTSGWSIQANGTACNDGNACTQSDTCQAGACSGGNPVVCSASDGCHVAGLCDPSTGTCSSPALNDGTACDDGNACTKADQCTGGVCHGTAYTCSATSCDASSSCDGNGGCVVVDDVTGTSCPDDGNPCTSDTCDGAGSCTHPAVASGTGCGAGLVCVGTACSAGCFIGGTLYAAGTVNPGNACQVCAPGTSTSAWANRANATACNDGNACTSGDTCTSGVCGGAPTCAPTSCQVSSTCNGNGACTVINKPQGTPCPDALPFLSPGVCMNGSCWDGCYINQKFWFVQTNFGLDQALCHNCDPSKSTTSFTTEGQSCYDQGGNAFCQSGVCVFYVPGQGGLCTPGCQDCTVTPCGTGGQCYGFPQPGGTCSHGNPCSTETCVTGVCSSQLKFNGTSCGSGLTCTNGHCG